MNKFLLMLSQQDAASAVDFDEIFLWNRSAPDSFTGTLSPHLDSFGPVDSKNVDFVRIALGVLAADRSTRRRARGSSWNARDISLTVQVSNPVIWASVEPELAKLVAFLTGDRWSFVFAQAAENDSSPLPISDATYTRTVLTSGGADSAAGALISARSFAGRGEHALVSHFSSTAISPVQKALVGAIQKFAPTIRQVHHQVHLNRRSTRADGSRFKDEPSTRSRSLLFLAIGLAVAERTKSPLWIPENGFASLNPPLGPDRRGSLSTHTTHPKFLYDLQQILETIGAHGLIENPFQHMTKGEMFTRVAEELGTTAASDYLSATNSCSHTDARYSGAPPGSSCGVCFGCLVRRASFASSGIKDQTIYLCNDPSKRFQTFVDQKSIVEPMRDFAMRGIRPRDVMAMSLPVGYTAGQALDLCQRGTSELREFLK